MQKVKKHHAISFLVVMTFFISFAFFLSLTPVSKIEAQNPPSTAVTGTAEIVNMPGYSIYFSGTNANGGSVQYDANGNLSGYAWSPEYGKLDFSVGSPKINLTTGEMTGKARMLSLQNPNDTESTEWADGWVSFKGIDGGVLPSGVSANMTYGVKFNPATGIADSTNHWAWGGNVIGWIDFSNVKIPTTIITGPVCTISPASSAINPGDSITFYWSGSNLATNGCNATAGSGSWSGNGKATSGSFPATPTSTTTYKMSCLGNDTPPTTSPECSTTITVDDNCHDSDALNYGDPRPCKYKPELHVVVDTLNYATLTWANAEDCVVSVSDPEPKDSTFFYKWEKGTTLETLGEISGSSFYKIPKPLDWTTVFSIDCKNEGIFSAIACIKNSDTPTGWTCKGIPHYIED